MTERAAGALDEQARKRLVESLLGVRRFGAPPFLVRNLKYVKDHRHEMSTKLWDLKWATNPLRGRYQPRQLSLKCVLRRCILPDAVYRRFIPRGAAASGVVTGRVRLWLSVVTGLGENIAFGVREGTLRLWMRTHADGGAPIDDLNVTHTFDVSGILAFLETHPARMSVIAEIYAQKSRSATGENVPILRGEQCLLDRDISDATSVPNKDFVIHLYNCAKQPTTEPKMGLSPKSDKAEAGSSEFPIDTVQMKDRGHRYAYEEDTSMISMLNSRGIVTLSLTGVLRNLNTGNRNGLLHSEHILIECQYNAPEFPWWEGIVRHDFICPWCHRNCRRLRTLLFHFQLDHDRADLSLEAVEDPERGNTNTEPSFILIFNITPVNGRPDQGSKVVKPKSGATIPDENVVVNKRRFSGYQRNIEDYVDELDMTKCRVSGKVVGSETSSDTTQYDDIPLSQFGGAMGDGWARCQACGRSHQRIYKHNIKYCSEWCEIAHKNNVEVNENGSAALFSSRPTSSRRKRIDFRETLGDKTLYHVVSLTPFLEDHFDEDGADSEDDIDHSWRFRIVEDKLAALEDAYPKNRVLWTMWNRYAFENYPAPGAYAERYTRYACEMFVFEYGSEIQRLNLRLQLCAFLRILHEHGCIDADAFKSVLLCLDGKKKRRQCAVSGRPENTPVPDHKFAKSRKAKSRMKKKS